MREKKSVGNRIALIDEVRGFAILCMVVYHTFYDLVFLFGVNIPAFHSPILNLIRDLFVYGFLFISGASSRLSRNNLKRGAICLGLGLGMTAVTFLFLPDSRILFGILHCLGICMLLHPLFAPLLDRIPTLLGVGGLTLLFLLTVQLPAGHLGIAGVCRWDLPPQFYQTEWLFPIGLPSDNFFSADYFPLFPWLFAFLTGSYFGRWLKSDRCPEWWKKPHLRPLAFVGRHTIWVYLLHQPVVFGVLWLIMTALGR